MVGATLATSGVRRPTRKGCPNRAVKFKRGLGAAACKPGISVAKLALEHGVNTNLLFKWRREYRAGKFGAPDPEDVVPQSVPDVPVAAAGHEAAVTLLPVCAPSPQADAVAAVPSIEVVFACATVRICGVPELAPLRMVLACLARRS